MVMTWKLSLPMSSTSPIDEPSSSCAALDECALLPMPTPLPRPPIPIPIPTLVPVPIPPSTEDEAAHHRFLQRFSQWLCRLVARGLPNAGAPTTLDMVRAVDSAIVVLGLLCHTIAAAAQPRHEGPFVGDGAVDLALNALHDLWCRVARWEVVAADARTRLEQFARLVAE